MSARTWTASVVITLAAAGGCDKSTDSNPAIDRPNQASDGGDEMSENPPPPEPEPEPIMSVNPPPPDPQPVEADPLMEITEGDSTTSVQPDGSCRKFVSVDCPPQVACNPPPPQDVKCPPQLEAGAAAMLAKKAAESN